MTTRFVITGNNNRRIAYDVTGSGTPIVLLHGGLIHDRSSWHNAGYVERLSKEFSVIAIDLRGHGESDTPERPEDYSAGKLLADVQAVADACGAGRFVLWGYSFGGTVALQAASRSERVIAAVIGGSYFGPILTSENFEALVLSFERMIAAKEEGRLDSLRGDQRAFAEQSNLNVGLAIFKAMSEWRPIEPEDLLCPALVYCGSRNEQAMTALQEREQSMRDCGVEFQIFQGLDHMEEFQSIDTVYEPVVSFIRSIAAKQSATRLVS